MGVLKHDGVIEASVVELRILEISSGSRFLTGLVAAMQNDGYLLFIMEHLSGGDLMHWIINEGKFSKVRAQFYSAQGSLYFNFF